MQQLLPHSEHKERCLLCACMEEKFVFTVTSQVHGHHFYIDAHQKIYNVITKMLEEGIDSPNMVNVQQANLTFKLGIHPADVTEILGIGYAPFSDKQLQADIDEVVVCWKRRMLITNLVAISGSAYDKGLPIEKITDSLNELISEASNDDKINASSLSDLASEATKKIIEAHNPENKYKFEGIESGFPALDGATRGMKKGEMIIIAARPSVGKTTFAMNILDRVWKDYNAIFFSLEMSADQLINRAISARSLIPMHRIIQGMVKQEEIESLHKAIKELKECKTFVYDKSGVTISWIRNKVRHYMIKESINLVVIDYIQLIRPEDSRAQRVQQVAEISHKIKEMAKDLEIPVIAVAQLNRDPEKRQDGVPRLSDLRECGDIEADADTVLLLWRPEMHAKQQENTNECIANLAIAKNRHGPTGKISLRYIKDCFYFEEQ